MKVITYVRDSTGKPSLEDQQERLLEALRPDCEIVGSYSDVASGSSTQRPGLTQALEKLAAGEAQTLCVQSLDRLTRRADQLEVIRRWCKENGFVIQEFPDVPDNQWRRL